MLGAVTPETCRVSDFAVNKYLYTVVSGFLLTSFPVTSYVSRHLFMYHYRKSMLLESTFHIHPKQDFFKVSAHSVFRIRMIIMPRHIGWHIERGQIAVKELRT